MEVEEAVVLVTGASSGIGRATAIAFADAGARVAAAARRRERLTDLAAQSSRILVVPTDLSHEDEAVAMVERTLDHFGRLDVLINNAGAGQAARSDALEAASTRQLFETNLFGAMTATRRAVGAMRRQGRGHIINICSPAGFLGVPMMADYCASKVAMSGWTRTLQAEWADTAIAVTEYLPGLIATELGRTEHPRGDVATTGGAPSHDRARGATGPLAPQPPERVAAQLVACVRRPRLLMYSSFSTRLLCLLMHSPRLRRGIGSAIGRAQRKQMKSSTFTDEFEA